MFAGRKSSVTSVETPREGSTEESIMAEVSKAVQEIIQEKVSQIIKPLLDEVSDDMSYDLLHSESSVEIKTVADDIAQSFVEKMKTEAGREVLKPSANPKSQWRHRLFLRYIGKKIRTLVAKRFARVSLHCILAQIKTKYHLDSAVESEQSTTMLVARVDALLLEESNERSRATSQGADEVCDLDRFKDAETGQVLALTQELTELLYCQIVDGRKIDIIPFLFTKRKMPTLRVVDVPVPHLTMYSEIWNRTLSFLSMMRWWLGTQATSHSEKVTLTLMDSEKVEEALQILQVIVQTPPPLEEEPASVCQGAEAESVQNLKFLRDQERKRLQVILEKLFTRICGQIELDLCIRNPGVTIQALLDKIWDRVKDEDYVITPDTLKYLDKAIFQEVRNKISPEMLMTGLILTEPVIVESILSAFTRHLKSPPPCRSRRRIFSSMGKSISKVFRRG